MLSDESEAKLPTGLWKLIGKLIKVSTELDFRPWDDRHSALSETRPQPSPACYQHSVCVLGLENPSILGPTPAPGHVTESQRVHREAEPRSRGRIDANSYML